jgi:LemA protein
MGVASATDRMEMRAGAGIAGQRCRDLFVIAGRWPDAIGRRFAQSSAVGNHQPSSNRLGRSSRPSRAHRRRGCDIARLPGRTILLDTSRSTVTGVILMRRFFTALAAVMSLSLTNCGYNAIQNNDEQVKSSWSEVVNQYQRRADLVPNLVNSVKGFAQQEKDVLLGVTNARAKVGSIQATPEVLNDPAAFQKFQQAQGELTGALSRLLVVTENYPQLKSDALFHDLMAQLEGTENRITVARNRYIKAVQEYNVGIRTFPNNLTAMAFGYKEKPNFTVENEKEISTAPKVDFGTSPTPAPQPAK